MLSILNKIIDLNPLRQLNDTDRKVLSICIFAAFFFWLILNLSNDYTINSRVEVEYLVDPERALIGRMPMYVDTKIKGQGWNLLWENLRFSDLKILVDLRNQDNLKLTESDVRFEIERKLTSGELSVTSVGFETMTIMTTPREGKRVPVVLDELPAFAKGHTTIHDPVIEPDSIMISGPSDYLSEIDSWKIQKLNILPLEQDFSASVDLETPTQEGISLSYDRVNLRIQVESVIQQKFTIPIRTINAPKGIDSVRLIPGHVELWVDLPESEYNIFTPNDFRVVADLSDGYGTDLSSVVPLTITKQPIYATNAELQVKSVKYYVYISNQQ